LFWRYLNSGLPLAISLIALIFSGLQWIDAHQEKSFSTRPLVDFVLENVPDNAHWIGLAIRK
jgi:hypothetical protein